MKQYKRLPRKLKKKLGPAWKQYLEDKNTTMERDYHLDNIFNKDYNSIKDVIQEALGE